jgi:eukaryotic-like serine/threonine-protein kinase
MDAPVLQPKVLVADTYEIERLIGRGGMGEVWAASHKRLPGKQVAVKVLRLSSPETTSELLARFKREAEIAARLSHPNIVEVLDFNTLPTGQPYIVMELLRGESLGDRLKRGPMPFEALKPIARQVGAALEAAHALGVVHRDLKPENIFLVPTALGDQVKVLDFGISKLAESNTLQTTDSVLIGTPLYMSPEQALGHNRDVSAQSDVFSFGSICYEALAGQAPFAAPSIAQVVFKIAYETPASVTDSVASLPVHAVQAIDHALQKNRANRTTSAKAFVEELTQEALTLSQPTPSGIYVPESKLTPSMISGATATPATSKVPPASSPSPKPLRLTLDESKQKRSTSSLWLVLGVLVLGGAGPLAWKLTRSGDPLPDLKLTLPALAAVETADAAVATTVLESAQPDGGTLAGTHDSPAEVDAGARIVVPVTVKPVIPAGPPRTVDDEVLKEMNAALGAKQFKQLWNRRAAYDIQLKSFLGKREGLLLVLEAGCTLREPGVTTIFNQLSEMGPLLRTKARRVCKKSWPEREL